MKTSKSPAFIGRHKSENKNGPAYVTLNYPAGALLRPLILAAILACTGWPAKAVTYYVATNGKDTAGDGSAANPLATMQHADAAGLLQPGDEVIVQAGAYTQSDAAGVVLSTSAGTAGSNITYQANGAVVINQTSGAGSYGFNVSVPGITLNGFEISGAQHGIYLAGSANSTVNACVIHDANGGGDAEGIFVNQSDNVTLTRNVIYNIHAAGEAP